MTPTTDPIAEPVLIGRLWHFPDGTTLPLVSGGADDTDDDADKDGGDDADDDKDDDADAKDDDEDEDLTDEEKADAKAASRKWEALAKKHKARAIKAEKEAKEAKDANASDSDKAKNAARAEGEKAARERLAGRLFVRAVRDLAKDRMSVPARLIADADAVKRLLNVDLDDVVDEDGEVDEDAISEAIDALLAEEPDLAKKADDDAEGKPAKGKAKAPTGARTTKGKRLEDLSVEEMRAHLAKGGKKA